MAGWAPTVRNMSKYTCRNPNTYNQVPCTRPVTVPGGPCGVAHRGGVAVPRAAGTFATIAPVTALLAPDDDIEDEAAGVEETPQPAVSQKNTPPAFRTLADLKRAVKVGTRIRVLDHGVHTKQIGAVRTVGEVRKVDTIVRDMVMADGTAEHNLAYYLTWEKAGAYTFPGGTRYRVQTHPGSWWECEIVPASETPEVAEGKRLAALRLQAWRLDAERTLFIAENPHHSAPHMAVELRSALHALEAAGDIDAPAAALASQMADGFPGNLADLLAAAAAVSAPRGR